MKHFSSLIACIACAMFVSCSGGPSSKTITPTSTEFSSGELARYIEIAADAPEAELVYIEQDGAIPTQYLRLKVTLEKVKAGFENVDARDIGFTRLLSVMCINLVDEYGTEVQDVSIKSEECLKLKKLLTGPVYSTAEIVFEGEYHNSKDAPKWYKRVKQFTPYLTGDITTTTSANSYSAPRASSDSDGLTALADAFKSLAEMAESLDDDDDDDDDSWFDDDDDDESVDEFIAEYEKFFKRYMTIIKKLGNNDMSVWSDYAAMLTEYQSYNQKLANMRNKMSVSQFNRLNKMNLELLSEIQKMQEK